MSLEYRSTEVFLRPDVRFKSILVTKFINCLMHKGKKSVAEKVFYQTTDILQTRFPDKEPLEIVETAINNVKPLVEVKSKRVGGATYQVPREVSESRKVTLALRWLIGAARAKKGKPMAEKLSEELLLAAKNEGGAIKKKEDTRRMAEANRAFAHFAW